MRAGIGEGMPTTGMYILFACVCVYVFGGVRTNRFSVDNSGNTFIILVLLLLAF